MASGKPGRGAGSQNPGLGGTANAANNPNQPQSGPPANWTFELRPLPVQPPRPVTDNVGVPGKPTPIGGSGPGPNPYEDQGNYANPS